MRVKGLINDHVAECVMRAKGEEEVHGAGAITPGAGLSKKGTLQEHPPRGSLLPMKALKFILCTVSGGVIGSAIMWAALSGSFRLLPGEMTYEQLAALLLAFAIVPSLTGTSS